MNAVWWFPLLALAFGLAAAWRAVRSRRFDPAARTWALLAVVFGAVSLWQRMTFVH
jgi:hypothetical protein